MHEEVKLSFKNKLYTPILFVSIFLVALYAAWCIATLLSRRPTWAFGIVEALCLGAIAASPFFIKNHLVNPTSMALVAASIGWIGYSPSLYWLCILYGLVAFISPSNKPWGAIIFSEKEIQVSLFGKKKLAWSALNGVVLNAGLLTIDHKNNRLFQEPVWMADQRMTEQHFNELCKRWLKNRTPA